jgi:UDP-N-acetylmuramoyl-tripeptide--D-alanyl-D-alanine ligase
MNARPVLFTHSEAAAATAGHNTRGWNAFGVSIDSRTLAPGDLYIALEGNTKDGHEFVADALQRGAAAALVSMRPEDVPADAPLLTVKDTQAALEGLGRAARARAMGKILAVTGSAGKTTTKEMLRLILSRAGLVSASVSSFNNHWGVPLSLARMPRDCAFGVFEVGMNHAGEIRALVAQVRPHVAIVTTIAPAHLEYFGTLEAIADAKAEIFEGLENEGAAILPADNSQFERLKAHAKRCGVARTLTFGRKSGVDARLLRSEPSPEGQIAEADIAGRKLDFAIGAAGEHIASNAVAALLAAHIAGADVRKCAGALAEFAALKGRGARFSAGGIDVIDESYNANPASMEAALALLGRAPIKAGARRIAVLGDMLELGEQAEALHRALCEPIADAAADLVFLCGPKMKSLWNVLPNKARGEYAEQSAALAPKLLAEVKKGDVLLVKGSFGSRMSVIIDALRARDAAPAAAGR